MAANRLPASLMNALDPAAGARRSRWTAARAGAPRCPCISRCSRPASGQTLIVPSSFGRGELPRRLRAPFARSVIPGAHAADRARQTWSWARGSLSRPFDQITSAGRNLYEWYARARFRPDFEFVVGRIKAMLAIELDMNYGQTGSNDGGFP